jgi:hypothetical protein
MNRKPYLLSEFSQTVKDGKLAIEVHCPQCPNCLNVDGRWTLKHHKKDSTIISVVNYETSGSLMKCLFCEEEFKWSSGKFNLSSGNNVNRGTILTMSCEMKNDVLVPIEYFEKVLGLGDDVYMYL